MLLIVKGWLKWVRGETWSHNGRFLVCKKLKFFIGVPNVNWLTESERAQPLRNVIRVVMDWLQPRVASERESLRRSVAAGNEELSLSFPAPCLLRLLSRATSD